MDAKGGGSLATVFYDGGCGLCHRFVRGVAAADTTGTFRFAPLGGETWRAAALGEPPAGTVVVRLPDGVRLFRSDAVIAVWSRLGGAHARRAAALEHVPRPLRDLGYRAVAAVRRLLAPRPGGPCPLVPAGLRGRFLP